VLGHILGDFVANSSGHPDLNSDGFGYHSMQTICQPIFQGEQTCRYISNKQTISGNGLVNNLLFVGTYTHLPTMTLAKI
jgi:hypothetical protein